VRVKDGGFWALEAEPTERSHSMLLQTSE